MAEAAFSPDGRSVMTTFGLCYEVINAVGGERSVRIWNTDSGKLLHTLKDDLGLNKRPEQGGYYLQRCTACHSFPAVEDTTTNTVAEDQILGAVRHAEFSQDGRRLLAVSEDSFVRLADDALPAGRKHPDGDNRPGVPVNKLSSGVSVRFAPVRVWDVASGKKLDKSDRFHGGRAIGRLQP